MQRYKVKIAYDGTDYCGFQRQSTDPTIQAALEEALHYLDQQPVQVVGASRTDAKVHAMGQVAHFDLKTPRPAKAIQNALNARLPREIRVLEIDEVEADFHARFHAKQKVYTYTLSRSSLQSPFLRNHTLHFPHPLDLSLMDQAIEILQGTHDFIQFSNTTSKENRPPSTVRTLFDIRYEVQQELMTFFFTGDGFLYNMVRNLMGALIEVGSKKMSLATLAKLLKEEVQPRTFTTMPPYPLTLKEISY
jgi:tRNA pseudouridine38-40 synthase